MIKNERHPSWVSFVTIFLPVSLRSTTFSTVSAARLCKEPGGFFLPVHFRRETPHFRPNRPAKGAAVLQ